MSGEVKLCLIGAGGHATRNIYPSLYRLEGVSIVANCDLREDAARAVAKRFGIARSYGDFHQMLKQERPDAAIVCTGAAGHATIAVELLNAGVHVYTEKPTASSLEGALKMLAAQRRSGKICMTAYKKRFAPAYVRAKELIESPDFGARGGLNIIRSSAGPVWAADKLRGHLLEWTCHTLDLGVFLWGQVNTVTTTTMNHEGRYAWSVVMQHDGVAVSHQLLTNCPAHPIEQVYCCGSGGTVIHVDNSINLLATKHGRPVDGYTPSFTTGRQFSDIEQGFAGELVAFVNAVRDGCEPEASIRQACHTLAIFEAMWLSANNGGKPVSVEYKG